MERLSEFQTKYYELQARTAPFKLKTDFETVKTVAIVRILLERALNFDAGASARGRYGFGVGYTAEECLNAAERYIEALEAGKEPLKGKFTEPGIALVDHSVIVKDGHVHLFYNRSYPGYEWDTMPTDTVGHAVTEDLVNWKIEPPVISVDVNMFENYQVWSPGVAEKDGKYFMYYTGVNINSAQAICLATSDDLYSWTKYENNPVLTPGEWGNWDASRWSDCRDSMVFVDGNGTAYMYYCTCKRDEITNRYVPAVGIASSKDMVHWTDRGAHVFDICDIALESPFLLKKDGKYYLFYTNCGHGTAYAVSDDPVSGWKSLGPIIEGTHGNESSANVPSCAEVFEFKGKWYITCCERLPRFEQYLEIFELKWNADGTAEATEPGMRN